MSLLRLLFIVLLLLNVLAFSSGMGWLSSPLPKGEPERLSRQINPESLHFGDFPSSATAPEAPTLPPHPDAILADDVPPSSIEEEATTTDVTPADPEPTPSPPAVAVTPPPVPTPAEATPQQSCLRYNNLSLQATRNLEAAAMKANPNIKIKRRSVQNISGWWVYIPAAASKEDAEERVKSLRAKGVSDLFIIREQGSNYLAISLGVFSREESARQQLGFLKTLSIQDAVIGPRNTNSSHFDLELTGMTTLLNRLAEQSSPPLPPGKPCTL